MGSLGKLLSDTGCGLCGLVPPPALLLTQPKPPEGQTELALDKAPLPLRGLRMIPSLFVAKVLGQRKVFMFGWKTPLVPYFQLS